MSLEYPCVYHKEGWCYLDPTQSDPCVFGPCDAETPSNGDFIRRMSDEQLAKWLAEQAEKGSSDDPEVWLDWLKKPVEGEDEKVN